MTEQKDINPFAFYDMKGCPKRPKRPKHRRKKAPDAWKEYDAKKAAWKKCIKDQLSKGAKRWLAAPLRAGVLTAFRINLFGMATRMYPAFASESEMKSRKFKPSSKDKAQHAWDKLQNFWENKLGGKENNLKKAITNGYTKRIFKLKKKSGITGISGYMPTDGRFLEDTYLEDLGSQYGEVIFNYGFTGEEPLPVIRQAISKCKRPEKFSNVVGEVATVVAASLPVIAIILQKVIPDADKNPYEDGANPDYEKDINDPDGNGSNVEGDEDAAKDMLDDAAEDVKQGGQDSDNPEDDKDAEKDGNIPTDKIWGMPKWVVYTGGALLGALVIYVGYKVATKGSGAKTGK